MTDRKLLPNREQIAAIDDLDVLAELIDDVGFTIAKIETDLEFGDGSEAWATKARSALTVHRHCQKMLERRVATVVSEQGAKRKREAKAGQQATSESNAQLFVAVCRERLSAEDWRAAWEEVHRRTLALQEAA